MNKNQLANLIEKFCRDAPDLDSWAWDDFISVRQADTEIEAIRQRLLEIEISHPPSTGNAWCSEAGFAAMAELAVRLRKQQHS